MTLFYIFLALLIWAFLPKIGFWALWQTYRAARAREQVEDALKHLLDNEQNGLHATIDSLAGALDISRKQAGELAEHMAEQGLLVFHGMGLHLTPDGERWAMHVVRAHRLWERYLADEARMPLEKIHREAHRREHSLSSADVDALDAALGYPRFDPHGDPIPRSGEQFSAPQGTPVNDWPLDTPGQIIHLEDEPRMAYQQILAAGLQVGQVVRVLERTPQRVVLSDGENEYRLAPAVAANVHLTAAAERTGYAPDVIPLHQLAHGQSAEIVALDDRVQGFTRRRFLDLGLTPGTRITPELENFFREPRAYRVRGTLIALRNNQAAHIFVRPIQEETALPLEADIQKTA